MHKNEFGQIIGEPVENWRPAEFPGRVSLSGQFCFLEPIDVDKHSDALFDALQVENQGESWTYLPYGPFNSKNEFRQWLQETDALTDTRIYAIFDSKTRKPIGVSAYLNITPTHGAIEVGHLHFSALLKRTAIATEAMYLMMKQAFDQLGYRRYEWKCNALNLPSKKAAERLGFQFEGVFRQHYVLKGRNRDTAWYSIIDSEWPEIKARFERWLDPKNFDASGRQIQSLTEI